MSVRMAALAIDSRHIPPSCRASTCRLSANANVALVESYLRWEHLFKAVLKGRCLVGRGLCPRDDAASKFENRINYVHDVAVMRHDDESASPVPACATYQSHYVSCVLVVQISG